jgi:hypothetical protein
MVVWESTSCGSQRDISSQSSVRSGPAADSSTRSIISMGSVSKGENEEEWSVLALLARGRDLSLEPVSMGGRSRTGGGVLSDFIGVLFRFCMIEFLSAGGGVGCGCGCLCVVCVCVCVCVFFVAAVFYLHIKKSKTNV